MNLAALQARRLRLHGLHPSRPLRDARSAAAFVRERGVVMITGRSSLPVLSEAIAGRPVRGSWMAAPEVHRIYDIMQGLRRYDLVEVPLILGKAVLVNPALGPAVERIARDRGRRLRARGRLPPLARHLLEAVEAQGSVRMDSWGIRAARSRPARTQLERELLVAATGIHTEGGYHTVILRPWRSGRVAARFGRASRRLGYDEAADALLLAAVRSAVAAPEREARRWFPFSGDRIEALLDLRAIVRIREGRVPYLVVGEGYRH